MIKRCKCGGCLATWTGNEGEDLNYRGLGVCIECGQYYQQNRRNILPISKQCFNSIVNQRRHDYFTKKAKNRMVG